MRATVTDNAAVEIVFIIAGIAIAVMLTELLLPTGGILAVIGAAGLIVAGGFALTDDADSAEYIGAGLITLGVLSLIAAVVIGRKVLSAHRDEPVRTGWEELVGMDAEVRAPLNPVGQIYIEGALWKARVPDGDPEIGIGNRVRVESVDGLTLIVRPASGQAQTN
jgi:membrane-bound serine protease (ClpP class)